MELFGKNFASFAALDRLLGRVMSAEPKTLIFALNFDEIFCFACDVVCGHV
jgi:hypothetical protein